MIKVLAAIFLLGSIVVTGQAQADSSNAKLQDGFDGQDFSTAGGLYYRENAEQRAGTVEFQSDVKYSGTGALKLSVRPHCKQAEENCSERAEIWEKTALRVPYDEATWFGFAVRLDDPVPQDDHRYLIAQWKREIGPTAEGDFSPFLAFRLDKGKLFVTVETNYHPSLLVGPEGKPARCPEGQTPVWLRPDVNQMRALVVADSRWQPTDGKEFNACTDKISVVSHGNSLPSADSGWIDFAILAKPGPDGTGHIEIFANRKWIATVKGYIGHNDAGLGKNQYFKFGPYRAGGKGIWTVYYDVFRRSPHCLDVLKDVGACAAVKAGGSSGLYSDIPN